MTSWKRALRSLWPGLVMSLGLAGSLMFLPAQTVAQLLPVLEPVPQPDLSGLEPAVRVQLADARLILDEALADEEVATSRLAESFGTLGRLYQAYDLGAAARACYRNAVTLAPGDLRWNHLLGYLLQSEGEFEWAALFYQRVQVIDPTDLPSTVHLAEVRLQQGREEEALRLYERALELDSRSAAAHFGLGQIALSQRRYEDAVRRFERALTLAPAATQIHYPLALAYRSLGRMEEARQHLELRGEVGVRVADPLVDALDGLKTGEVVYLAMGKRAFEAGDYSAAVEYFRKAVEAAPDSFRGYTNLGAALSALGDEENALQSFLAAAEAGSESTALYYNLGVLLNRRGRYGEAADRLRFILDREPRDQPARLELARSLQATGQPEAALEQLRAAVQLRPEDGEARLREASLLAELGRFKEAVERLIEAHRLLPEDAAVANALARLLAASPDRTLRDGERALGLALAAFRARPTPFFGETVGLALAEAGRCSEALQWQQDMIEQARESGAVDWAERFGEKLEEYRQQPCRP